MIYRGSIEFTVTERDLDRVVSVMPITDGIRNPFGAVHAGAILWFADVTATRLVLGDREVAPGMTETDRRRQEERPSRAALRADPGPAGHEGLSSASTGRAS